MSLGLDLRMGVAVEFLLPLTTVAPWEVSAGCIDLLGQACAHAPMRETLERAAEDSLDDAAMAKLRRG